MSAVGAAYLLIVGGRTSKLRRSGIEAEDAVPMGLVAGWDPSATNRPLLRSAGIDLPVGGSPVLPIFRIRC
jgi:hypothetical protein